MADTQLNQLIINELTKAQYSALTPAQQQLYLVTDERTLVSGDNISLLNNDAGYVTTTTAVQHTASTAVGSTIQPIYVAADGTATATTYALNKTVPSDAVFTDTVTTVTTSGAGNAITSLNAENGQITATKGATFLTEHQDISGKENVSNKTTTLSSASTDIQYPSAKLVYDQLLTKQNVINSTNKLSADVVDDSSANNKFVTATQKTNWDTVYGKVPSQTYTSGNELADKNFVNSSIATNTANFLGTLDVVTDLGLSYGAATSAVVSALNSHTFSVTKTNNDYTFVINKDNDDHFIYQRYKWVTDNSTFAYEYTLNNSSFTASQWATINSGITSALVTDIGLNSNSRHSHSNKSLLDTYSQTEANLADAVSKKHTHSNMAILNTITSSDKVRTITVSTSDPSGGSDGDIWLKYEA